MRHLRTVRFLSVLSALALTAACGASGATGDEQEGEYSRPVELVVPFGPGGGADALGRALAKQMEGPLGVDVPVVNVPGATGGTGLAKMLSGKAGESVAVLTQDTMTTSVAGSASFSLDDVRAVCRLQSMPSALMVRTGDYEKWEDLVAAARKRTLTVATVGTHSVDDIVLGAVSEAFGTTFRAVPFSEPSERYGSVLNGDVDVLYEQLGDVRQYLDSGEFTPLAIIAEEAPEDFADVPTAADLGLPADTVLPQFRGIVTSAEASDEQVEALAAACEEAAATDELASFQDSVYAAADSYQGTEFDDFLAEQAGLVETQLEAYGITD